MAYAIAFGGLFGTAVLAYALFGAQLMFPRWKRWALGAMGFLLAATLWIVHPQIGNAPPDGSSLADQWP